MTLKNSLHRRTHKERSQLAHRSKLGILEKHKDYVLRARDYHAKQDHLNRLRQKAAERNKDEFYFSMVREKTRKGVHITDRGNVALPVDIVKVLKSQDENYVRTMRMSNAKKIDKLKNQLTTMADLVKPDATRDDENNLDEDELRILYEAKVLQGSGKAIRRRKPNHIVFAESSEEVLQYTNDGQPETVTNPSQDDAAQVSEIDLGWKSDEPKRKQRRKKSRRSNVSTISQDDQRMENDDLDDLDAEESDAQFTVTNKRRLLKELAARLHRDKQLRYAEREFEMQRLMMGKGARKKIAGVEKVNGQSESEEDEDEIDARKGRRRNSVKKVDEATYKPRVYKWKMERKR